MDKGSLTSMFRKYIRAIVAIALVFVVSGISLRLLAAGSNLIANPSVETVKSSNPASWSKVSSGTNTASFTYKTSGHTGKKSLYVKITKYTSGSRQWQFSPVTVKANTSYTYTDYSMSNVPSSIIAQYTLTDGKTKKVTIATNMAAHSSWFQKKIVFTTPAKTKNVTIYHMLNRVGWLQTDDFSLVETNSVPAPTASFSSPLSGATVSGTVNLAVNATNATGVQFKVDGVNLGSEDTVSPYAASWDTTKAANGSHVLTAVARNSAGVTVTTSVTVTVNNVVVIPPTISFSTPANGSSVNGTIDLTVSATNAAGVQFKVDGNDFGSEDTSNPYTIAWDTTGVTNGNHVLTAVARNSAGQTATATVNINVANPTSTSTNLVQNPSVETTDPANAQLPQAWQHNAWGTNTASFTYPVAGSNGSKAVRTDMTSYTDGDAKWYFTAVNASANTEYSFSDSYRSNVTTSVVVELQSTNGNLSYLDLGTIPASSSWAPESLTFTTAADTASFTVYHLINQVGWLEMDDVSVTKVTSNTSTNPIANSSMETANGNVPAGWISSSWGTNTTTFSYVNEGHTGSKSVKTTISSYTDGDAKWYYEPITTLVKGKQYRWTTWYKTDTRPQAVAMFTRADGSEEFFGMPQPFPAANSDTVWQRYSETFIVPDDAVSVTNFLFITGKGWVQVDDQSLESYQPTGWNRPLVTLTFDDGYEENVTSVLPVLDQYGFKSTQCFETADLKADPTTGKLNVMAFLNDGHEICSHTVTHPFLSQLTTAQVDTELADSKTYLQNLIGAPVVDFASPYGDYSESVNNEIKKYYQSHRTVDEGFNSKDNFDAYRLRVQNMTPTTTLAQFQSWLDQAKADNTWLILVYHRVTNDTPEAFDTRVPDFKQQMAALNASGLTVETMRDALAELNAQL